MKAVAAAKVDQIAIRAKQAMNESMAKVQNARDTAKDAETKALADVKELMIFAKDDLGAASTVRELKKADVKARSAFKEAMISANKLTELLQTIMKGMQQEIE